MNEFQGNKYYYDMDYGYMPTEDYFNYIVNQYIETKKQDEKQELIYSSSKDKHYLRSIYLSDGVKNKMNVEFD